MGMPVTLIFDGMEMRWNIFCVVGISDAVLLVVAMDVCIGRVTGFGVSVFTLTVENSSGPGYNVY